MKRCWNAVILATFGGMALGPSAAIAGIEVSASVQIHATTEFYEPLAPQGEWVEVGSYGRCWHPAHVAVEWRPYCYGSWEWTDCGWYWRSDEPWGWACYHYGSWVYDPVVGWAWVPGIEWAPAWVSWRVGGGYIGWAPLPPRGVAVVSVGVAAPGAFVFVESHRFHEPVRPATVVINNTTIINKTTQINNIRQETKNIGGGAPQKVMVNEGPGLEAVQKATGKKVKVVPIQEATRQTPVPPSVAARRTLEPKAAEPKVPEPKATVPNAIAPNITAPAKTIEPRPIEPKVAEPKVPEPKHNLPENVPTPNPQVPVVPREKEAPKVPQERRELPPREEAHPGPERAPVAPAVPPVRTPRPPNKGKEEPKEHGRERS